MSKFTISVFKQPIFPFLRANWLWILAAITLISTAYIFWYFGVKIGTATFSKEFWEMLDKGDKGKNIAYNIVRHLGFWARQIQNTYGLLFISFTGITLLLSEFNYQILFKNLFVEEGRKGKFFYLVILLFFYLFLILSLKSLFGKNLESIGLHTFCANFWSVSMIIYSYFVYASESYTKIRELALQKTKAELVALKAQINPHFLFNVLNNLYGQAIVEDSPKTAAGIERLSRIMRHVVEETKTERSPIEKEIIFLEDFIELQKMRIPQRPNIRIETHTFWDGEAATIAPLLVIPYIENAFKYGISITQESFIEMDLNVIHKELAFVCRNSIIKKTDKLEIGTGTGLENTHRRLNLYYPNRHQLIVNTDNGIFEVIMKVKL